MRARNETPVGLMDPSVAPWEGGWHSGRVMNPPVIPPGRGDESQAMNYSYVEERL